MVSGKGVVHFFGFHSMIFLSSLPPSLASLGPLVRKIKDNQIEVVVNTLCSNMFSDSEKLRDISRWALLGARTMFLHQKCTVGFVSLSVSVGHHGYSYSVSPSYSEDRALY